MLNQPPSAPQRAPQPAAQQGSAAPIVWLNGYQLRDALEFIAPDRTAIQLTAEVGIQHGPARTGDEGYEPAGMFCWYSEYPEEGSIRLGEGPDDCFANDEQPAPQPAAQQGGPCEVVKFTDQSTADPVEKARRYLKAMSSHQLNRAYFFEDGYPRRESAHDALATLAVLEQLAAAGGKAY